MTSQEARRTVAVVTGRAVGAGKGVAIALGHSAMTVYVTDRTRRGAESRHGGSIADTAGVVDAVGAEGFAVATDQADDDAVARLFAR
ncbi:hypothetical protein [Streptomyces sp. NPDC005244]|uniref:hypothetical protein n=1 Tax=Streptomyces sp. NPDC005244 TaxID=3364708 RepID=UPI0036A5C850